MTQNKIPTDEEILAKAKQRYTEEVPCFSWQQDHSRYVLQALGEARAAGREEQRERQLAALCLAKQALFHEPPSGCWATGPLSGDPILDLVVCPGCAALQSIEEAIRAEENKG